MSDNEIHTENNCKCAWCEIKKLEKRELIRAYRLVADDYIKNQHAWDGISRRLNQVADALDRELEAER